MAHHIGEAPLASPCRDNGVLRRDGAQRGAVPRDVRPLRVRRDPRPPPRPAGRLVRGRHQLGPGRASRTPSTSYASLQHMADHEIEHDVAHYWHHHMYASFMVDPLGPRADRPDRRRPGDVVVGLPAQREHVRLLASESLGQRGRGGRPRGGGQDRQHERARRSSGSTADDRRARRRTPTGLDLPAPTRSRADAPRAGDAAPLGHGRARASTRSSCSATPTSSYATGASWPLSDAGRGQLRAPGRGRPGRRRDAPPVHAVPAPTTARELDLDDDHLHGPTYLDFDEGVAAFAAALADLLPADGARSPSTR